jgi:hypothetical protein
MDANQGSCTMIVTEEHRPDGQGEQRLRLELLEYQVRTLLSVVAELAYAVDVMAFVSGEPHATVVLGRVKQVLAELGVHVPTARSHRVSDQSPPRTEERLAAVPGPTDGGGK